MKIAIMQPYFFPYVGYFQLMNAVDEFIVYDNIKYTKKGWINRNRILVNGKDVYITVPLKKDSDCLDVRDRYLASAWFLEEKNKMLNKIRESYRRAPYFDNTYPVIEKCILFDDGNLFRFLINSLNLIKEYLGIRTSLFKSSAIPIDHRLRAEKKVIAICKARKADVYLNPIGGVELYEKDNFKNEGIVLHFLETNNITYKQFNYDFIASLSIIDMMMFNSREEIKKYLDSNYSLI